MPTRRRPPPTIKLTATLATVLILPWTLNSGAATKAPRASEAAPSAAATKLSQQPLDELEPGVTVREITQDEPFTMVALTGADLSGTSARIRAKRPDGTWGPWYATAHETKHEAPGSRRPDAPAPGPEGTEPVFVGRTTAVQIAVTRTAPIAPSTGSTAKPRGAGPSAPGEAARAHPPAKKSAPADLGYVPATAAQPLAQNISAVLITPPKTPADAQWQPPRAVLAPGQPPNIIPRSHWGAGAYGRCGKPVESGPVHAAVVHHTAGSNDYAPEDSAEIIRAIYAYHTRTLGWCDIGYNALVDKYGQVFEGRAGGLTRGIMGSHAGGFNSNTWGVTLIGTFDDAPPPPIQLESVGRLLGWRLGLDRTDPRGMAQLTSAGGSFTNVPRGASLTLPSIIGHRDLDATECPGNQGYIALNAIREIAARFNEPPGPEDLARVMEGGAIHTRWLELGGAEGMLGAPTSPEAIGEGSTKYATFEHGAVYWSPETGAQPITGAIYDAWASLGYERGVLGLPTSAEIPEPEWVGQNFQHGTLNYNWASGAVIRVVDGVAEELPPPPPEGPPVQLERFSRVIDPFAGE
ncbi:N-acetylmuramoyl-L-alanine amidase [Mycolicibacter hiberniae]|uniref:N-acetylmuramoyl-L-alanine amidase n=1 Tax=Mycolicibacter hiberniae TaxID=29314 RepID=A0A7I7X812_9MYCO|nr:N-acetylmuramoyl-L-alanine amidase [Mycolicibacter hiberniae]ORV69028.1 cold-shock protein [Mycolicibacter hiberniae]BBZ25033.1 N-acetylmuramoyl-L-alanine amidase [Mycolicibacter hiberniae]